MSEKPAWMPTIQECAKLYLDEMKTRALAKSTLKIYSLRLGVLERYLDAKSIKLIDKVTTDVLKRFFQDKRDRGIRPHTIASEMKFVRAWLNYLLEIEVISQSPFDKIVIPRLPKLQKKCYTIEEIKKMLSVADDREQLVILLLVDTGVRSTEFCNINAGDIDLANGTVTVRQGKGAKDRTTFIGAQTRKHLIRYWRKHGKPDAGEPLVKSQRTRDGRLTKSGMRSIVKSISEKAGIEGCNVKKFRRTFAQWSLANDMDLRSIQLLMGHSDIKTTVEYLGDNVHDLKRKHDKFGPIDHSGI
jgi:integrase/recombinase XerD